MLPARVWHGRRRNLRKCTGNGPIYKRNFLCCFGDWPIEFVPCGFVRVTMAVKFSGVSVVKISAAYFEAGGFTWTRSVLLNFGNRREDWSMN